MTFESRLAPGRHTFLILHGIAESFGVLAVFDALLYIRVRGNDEPA